MKTGELTGTVRLPVAYLFRRSCGLLRSYLKPVQGGDNENTCAVRILVGLLPLSSISDAAELRVLAGAAFAPALSRIGAEFEQKAGHKSSTLSPDLLKRPLSPGSLTM